METATRVVTPHDAVWGVKWLLGNQHSWSLLDRTPPIRTDDLRCSHQDQQRNIWQQEVW